MFQVKGNAAGLGKVVAGSRRNNAQRGITSGTHNAIGGLVDTAVATCDDETPGTIVYRVLHLHLEMADILAKVYFDREARLAQQFTNARLTLASAPPSGGRVEKQVNGLGSH
jgi:hypothetical protein